MYVGMTLTDSAEMVCDVPSAISAWSCCGVSISISGVAARAIMTSSAVWV
ncbi:hypothetical protein [Candidatus Synchoanobacter obligatus]|uniref:Uncharacterized protein n=1 Tax=Candidatus Synchoanobacter obligatus TaxID=2919597 RepID=A0ABT1L420_9GAMM|nr:hypothetical protein [Candidatus Synchoanobacter obligatus]MCP8351924.1 hypothetical protein [Candidatus Synchoanobacter obligatus]